MVSDCRVTRRKTKMGLVPFKIADIATKNEACRCPSCACRTLNEMADIYLLARELLSSLELRTWHSRLSPPVGSVATTEAVQSYLSSSSSPTLL